MQHTTISPRLATADPDLHRLVGCHLHFVFCEGRPVALEAIVRRISALWHSWAVIAWRV